MNAILDALALVGAAATVRPTGEVEVCVRTGRDARRATLGLASMEAFVRDHGGAPGAAFGYARGVAAALAEPDTEAGARLSFEGAASALLPSLERAGAFRSGVRDTVGWEPYVVAFGGDVEIAFIAELGEGVRVLSREQVAAWGVSADRLERAAASILFDRSWGGGFEATGVDGVDACDLRDGAASARALILDLWCYDRVRDGALFAVPTPDTLLLSADDGAPAACALRAAIAGTDPARRLTDAIFRLGRGGARSVVAVP